MKPTIQYLPQWHAEADQELYRKLTSILDQVVSKVEFEIMGLRNKYLDYSSLNRDLTNMMIKEMGYEYITDVLELDDEQLHIILGYLGIIHAFKGTKPGLELCLQLMGAKYEITEWWEANPTKTPDTFSLLVDLNLSGMKPDTMVKLRSFVRQYVYPVMDAIEYTFHGVLTELMIRMAGVVITESNPGIQGSAWLMSRMAGVSVYDANGRPGEYSMFKDVVDISVSMGLAGVMKYEANPDPTSYGPAWLAIKIAGTARYAVGGVIRFFPESNP